MANTTDSQTYIFTFKLVSGYNVITLPNNIIIPNLKKILQKILQLKKYHIISINQINMSQN